MSLHVGFELEGLCAGKNIVLRTHPTTTTPVALFVDIVAWSSVHNIVVILVVI